MSDKERPGPNLQSPREHQKNMSVVAGYPGLAAPRPQKECRACEMMDVRLLLSQPAQK